MTVFVWSQSHTAKPRVLENKRVSETKMVGSTNGRIYNRTINRPLAAEAKRQPSYAATVTNNFFLH